MKKQLLIIIASLIVDIAIAQVGINTSTPQKTFHVNGSLQVTNELNVGGNATSQGSAGTYIKWCFKFT